MDSSQISAWANANTQKSRDRLAGFDTIDAGFMCGQRSPMRYASLRAVAGTPGKQPRQPSRFRLALPLPRPHSLLSPCHSFPTLSSSRLTPAPRRHIWPPMSQRTSPLTQYHTAERNRAYAHVSPRVPQYHCHSLFNGGTQDRPSSARHHTLQTVRDSPFLCSVSQHVQYGGDARRRWRR